MHIYGHETQTERRYKKAHEDEDAETRSGHEHTETQWFSA